MILAKDEEKWQSGKSILLPVHWVLAQRKGSWVMGERPVYIYHGIRWCISQEATYSLTPIPLLSLRAHFLGKKWTILEIDIKDSPLTEILNKIIETATFYTEYLSPYSRCLELKCTDTLLPLSGTLKALSENAAFFGMKSHTLQWHHHWGSSHQTKKPQKCKYSSFLDALLEVSSRYPHPLGTSFHLREEIKNEVLSRKLRTLLRHELFVLLRPVCWLLLTQTVMSVCWAQPLLSWCQL